MPTANIAVSRPLIPASTHREKGRPKHTNCSSTNAATTTQATTTGEMREAPQRRIRRTVAEDAGRSATGAVPVTGGR